LVAVVVVHQSGRLVSQVVPVAVAQQEPEAHQPVARARFHQFKVSTVALARMVATAQAVAVLVALVLLLQRQQAALVCHRQLLVRQLVEAAAVVVVV
jgi:hypothetical protein